eukprot:c15441_g1_i2.p2 GENE.c15441_g1_i2~~c15441_g1_i2.p2  ORF type:complete len:109 (+),score=12.44 c15441_g1_i2:49-327(+)
MDRERILIAKKMFWGGLLLLLPWMWIVNAWYFYGKNNTGRPSDAVVSRYTRMGLIGALIEFPLVLTWMTIYVTKWRTWGVWAEDFLVVVPKG